MELRPYQQECIDAVREAYRSGHRAPLLVAPTGSGKTVMFSYIARTMQERGKAVGILAHRSELLDQIRTALTAWGVGGDAVQVMSAQTLVRRLETTKFNPDLWILDEAHHCAAGNTWGKIRAHFAHARWLGVTATPCRLDGRSLADSFDTLVLGPSVEELINGGFLSRFKIWAPPTVDVRGLHVRAGEFVAGEVAERTGRPTIMGDILDHYRRLASGKQFIAFCPSIDFAERLAGRFAETGIGCAALHGHLRQRDRADRVRQFREARLCGITNCGIVEEGFDVPAVECGIFVTPTASLRRHLQSMGRPLRPKAGGGEVVLIDHVGNTERHGFPDEPREWTLGGLQQGPAVRAVARASVRICPSCFAATLSAGTTCSACGGVFPAKPRQVAQADGELAQLEKAALAAKRAAEREREWRARGSARTLEELQRFGQAKGYKPGWALHIWKARQRRWG